MTKRSIFLAFVTVIAVFGLLLTAGVLLSVFDRTPNRVIFSTFKDLLPLFLGIAAAWLAYCVQRRSAYQQQLRVLWSKLIESVVMATEYTFISSPSEPQYREVLRKLSIAIEEVRGVFCNLEVAGKTRGLYPFEPLKDIYRTITDLGSGGDFKVQKAECARRHIDVLWKDVRRELLKEFDREEPTFPHSHWAELEKGRIYDEHGIEKKPT